MDFFRPWSGVRGRSPWSWRHFRAWKTLWTMKISPFSTINSAAICAWTLLIYKLNFVNRLLTGMRCSTYNAVTFSSRFNFYKPIVLSEKKEKICYDNRFSLMPSSLEIYVLNKKRCEWSADFYSEFETNQQTHKTPTTFSHMKENLNNENCPIFNNQLCYNLCLNVANLQIKLTLCSTNNAVTFSSRFNFYKPIVLSEKKREDLLW